MVVVSILSEEAGACSGDFLWKQPLLHGSLFVVTSSGFVPFGCFRSLEGVCPIVLSLFPFDLFVVCTTAYHVFVILFVCWFSDGPVNSASRSRVGV